jgi:hypothetical protein
MLKIRVVLLFIFILINNLSLISQTKSNEDLKNEIKLGIFIDNIYNIDYLNSSYEVVFYIWVNSYNQYYPADNIDIDKSIEVEKVFVERDSIITPEKIFKYNSLVKYKAKILNQMDISKFPFDILKLNLDIELLEHYEGEKRITIDRENSILNPRFIDKWGIKKTNYKIENTNWNSNFGDISHKNESDLEALRLSFNLYRDSWNLYWKMFLVLFISLFLSSLNLFLPNKQSEEKFALIVGSLFTAIGNKYITESYLPFSDTINLSDILHVTTFIFISFYALYAIYEQRSNRKDSLKLDLKVFILSISLYFLITIFITYKFI